MPEYTYNWKTNKIKNLPKQIWKMSIKKFLIISVLLINIVSLANTLSINPKKYKQQPITCLGCNNALSVCAANGCGGLYKL